MTSPPTFFWWWCTPHLKNKLAVKTVYKARFAVLMVVMKLCSWQMFSQLNCLSIGWWTTTTPELDTIFNTNYWKILSDFIIGCHTIQADAHVANNKELNLFFYNSRQGACCLSVCFFILTVWLSFFFFLSVCMYVYLSSMEWELTKFPPQEIISCQKTLFPGTRNYFLSRKILFLLEID